MPGIPFLLVLLAQHKHINSSLEAELILFHIYFLQHEGQSESAFVQSRDIQSLSTETETCQASQFILFINVGVTSFFSAAGQRSFLAQLLGSPLR